MPKKIPLYPRTGYATKMAREFIIKSAIKSLPVNLFAICKKCGWTIKSVSETETSTNVIDPFEVKYNPDCDAKTYLTPKGRYLIVYDDTVLVEGRVLWTIAHEIGHIVLKHLEEFEQTEVHRGLTEAENSVLEKEANAFASELLAPIEVLIRTKCIKKNSIIKLCGLSGEAAENKENALKSYNWNKEDESIREMVYKQFYDFIHKKEFYHTIHHKVCPICKNYILSTREHFCRICGTRQNARTLLKGVVYNDGPILDKTGKVLVCPKCFSLDHSKNTDICIKCNSPIVNICSGDKLSIRTGKKCNKTHASDTRFCYECGSPTLFYSNEIIGEWQKAQKQFLSKNRFLQQLDSDEDTGRLFREWDYFVQLLASDNKLQLFSALSGSIAKLDYDTLFIFSTSSIAHKFLSDERILEYLIKMFKINIRLPLMEIIPIELEASEYAAATTE